MSPNTPGFKPKTDMSEAEDAWRKTAMRGKTPNEDVALAAAALAKLKAAQQVEESNAETQRSPTKNTEPNSSTASSSTACNSSNRAARRQQARMREKARRDNDEDDYEEEKSNEKQSDKGADDQSQHSLKYWGFLPSDEPLSSTDEEAEDPVKEREERVLRSRKRQIKAHLTSAIDSSDPLLDWSEVFAQVRIYDIKYLDDELTAARATAKRKGTSWLKELPRPGWLSQSHDRLEAIKTKYANVVKKATAETDGVNDCGDQFKAMVLASATFKETLTKLPEGLQAMLHDGESKTAKEDKVLGYELVMGREGVPCIGVRLSKEQLERGEKMRQAGQGAIWA